MCDIVWVSPQSHSSLSVKPHFLWHALQWPWPVRKRLSSDHWRLWRSKPGSRIVRSTTKVELTTVADCQSSLNRLVTSVDCMSDRWLVVTVMLGSTVCESADIQRLESSAGKPQDARWLVVPVRRDAGREEVPHHRVNTRLLSQPVSYSSVPAPALNSRPALKQGSHASWKVLGFFSWKFQDLESPGKSLWSWKILEKYPWKSCIFSSGSNGKQAAIV